MAHVYSSLELTWRKRVDGWALHLRDPGKPLALVVPDAKYPSMWRVSIKGKLSDMVNLARAKDAAVSLALADLNSKDEENDLAMPYSRKKRVA